MKKWIIYSIIIILIFFLSFYIGIKLNVPEQNETHEESISSTKEEKNIPEQNEIEPAVSEEKIKKEHYVLREVGKYIKVYSIDDTEKEELYMTTSITTQYLPETDKLSLEEGIHVYSKNELNEILQDFE